MSGTFGTKTIINEEPSPATYRIHATAFDVVNNSASAFSAEFVVAHALLKEPSIKRINSTRLHVAWLGDDSAASYDLQWSPTRSFEGTPKGLVSSQLEALVDVSLPVEHELLYFRVAQEGTGAWSPLSLRWTVASDCSSTQYLDDEESNDPTKWKCADCPEGGSCTEHVTWRQVKAKFGWWRNKAKGKTGFTPCIYPPACLGAPNPELKDRYILDNDTDAALINSPESCNHNAGHRAICRDGERCRLCHACRPNHEHAFGGKCRPCHSRAANRGVLAGGVAFALLAAALLVWLQINNKGEGGLSDALKKVLLNYLQVAALAAGFPLQWPEGVEAMFAVQSTVSTAGQYLLNPDCELSVLPPAVAFYNKMVGFALLPPLILLGCLLFWQAHARCRFEACCREGPRPWRFRPAGGSAQRTRWCSPLSFSSTCSIRRRCAKCFPWSHAAAWAMRHF